MRNRGRISYSRLAGWPCDKIEGLGRSWKVVTKVGKLDQCEWENGNGPNHGRGWRGMRGSKDHSSFE